MGPHPDIYAENVRAAVPGSGSFALPYRGKRARQAKDIRAMPTGPILKLLFALARILLWVWSNLDDDDWHWPLR